ncbi:carboxymuconolactone decarboxylase family protein [Kribbella sp. NBC_00709]|uniref:carboxymuconolactone decarboxylase family protein n=1 Tax=Kribbella sp. NBC_00709 TaxID=2975972 RepID=UPI002E2E00B4|nr:carboxymuconolactone decarboxylase family protein [Kribbella sp. NBC_00709]
MTMTNTDAQQQAIRTAHERYGDRWWPDLDPVLEDTELAEAYVRFAQVAAARGALSPKVRELVLLAVNASTTTLHEPSINRHIREALHHGASREEIVEVFEVVSVLGIHSAHTGLPVLLEILTEEGLIEPGALDERRTAIKEDYVARRGMWGEALEAMLVLDPELVEAYLNFSSIPWERGALSPALKELLYVAIDCSVTHLYDHGTAAHMQRALAAGATKEEIAGVLALISTLGVHSLTAGFRALNEIDG